MRVGVVLPHDDIGTDPEVIRSFVQTAERVGYAHLHVYDHVLGAVHEGRSAELVGRYTDETAFHEPLVLFGFVAAVTRSLELVTAILVLPQRQTALVAKQAAEVDLLSNGRLRLGIGTGWNFVEYESLHEDFDSRGRRQEEAVEVLRLLWSQPLLDYTGRWHRIDRASILPRPNRRIPIWMGGGSEPAYRRAARIADGFIFGLGHDPYRAMPILRRYVEEAGRDPSTFGFDSTVWVDDDGRWLDEAEQLRDAGTTMITISNVRRGFSPQRHVDELEGQLDAIRSRGLVVDAAP
jgi:probable F420-dependent oxidoreductase